MGVEIIKFSFICFIIYVALKKGSGDVDMKDFKVIVFILVFSVI